MDFRLLNIFSLKMTYPIRVQRLHEVVMGSVLTDEHIMRDLQSHQRLLVI